MKKLAVYKHEVIFDNIYILELVRYPIKKISKCIQYL